MIYDQQNLVNFPIYSTFFRTSTQLCIHISLSIPPTSYRHFSSLARRLGRIFAHAYFHHREAFEQAEAESSLYARFLNLTGQFDLVPAEFLVIPSSAALPGRKGRDEDVEPPRLLAAAVNPSREREDQNSHTAEQAQPLNIREKSPPGLTGDSPTATGSPRRLGRNRTDTMVFSEAYIVAEELAKDDSHDATESGILQDTAQSAEPESYSQDSWSGQRRDFPSDEFGYDVEEVSIATGSNSPPLELPSLRDSSPPAPVVPPGPERETETETGTTSTAAETIHDEPAVKEIVSPHEEPVAPPEHSSPVTPAATTDVGTANTDTDTVEEVLAAEKSDSLESVPQSEEQPEGPLEAPLEPSPEIDELVVADVTNPPTPPSEPAHDELLTEQEQEFSLDLSEPPPSEPIPPESESDITDEAHDADEELREVVGNL